jgi:hypothetical protein
MNDVLGIGATVDLRQEVTEELRKEFMPLEDWIVTGMGKLPTYDLVDIGHGDVEIKRIVDGNYLHLRDVWKLIHAIIEHVEAE